MKVSAFQFIKNTLKMLIGLIGLLITFFTVIDLMYFLSYPNYAKITNPREFQSFSSWNLLINMLLLSLFMIQHSALASFKIKEKMRDYHLQDIYRSFYIITTCIILQVLMKYWNFIPELTFYSFNINYRPLWWAYCIIHFFAWAVIYVGNICMDVNELLGIKQIYYSIARLPDPTSRKSVHLQRLNVHMRHPSFLGFFALLWVVPIMTLDRLLLASIFIIYMYVSWNTDEEDYLYQKSQYERKFFELERLQN